MHRRALINLSPCVTTDLILASVFEARGDNKPQVLLFSATMPPELRMTSAKYMTKNCETVNTVKAGSRAAEGYV